MLGNSLAALGAALTMHAGTPVLPDEGAKLADAIALTRLCPSLRIDRDAVAMMLARKGIRLAPIMQDILSRSRGMAVRYVHFKPREACRLGRTLYGSSGTVAAGFLADR